MHISDRRGSFSQGFYREQEPQERVLLEWPPGGGDTQLSILSIHRNQTRDGHVAAFSNAHRCAYPHIGAYMQNLRMREYLLLAHFTAPAWPALNQAYPSHLTEFYRKINFVKYALIKTHKSRFFSYSSKQSGDAGDCVANGRCEGGDCR